jgi:hypothetical protein
VDGHIEVVGELNALAPVPSFIEAPAIDQNRFAHTGLVDNGHRLLGVLQCLWVGVSPDCEAMKQ